MSTIGEWVPVIRHKFWGDATTGILEQLESEDIACVVEFFDGQFTVCVNGKRHLNRCPQNVMSVRWETLRPIATREP